MSLFSFSKRDKNLIELRRVLSSIKDISDKEKLVRIKRTENAVQILVIGLQCNWCSDFVNLNSQADYVGQFHAYFGKRTVDNCWEDGSARVAVFKNGTRYMRQEESIGILGNLSNVDGCYISFLLVHILQYDDNDFSKAVILRDTSVYFVQKGVNAAYFGNSLETPQPPPEIITNPQVAACYINIPRPWNPDTSGKGKWFCEWCAHGRSNGHNY